VALHVRGVLILETQLLECFLPLTDSSSVLLGARSIRNCTGSMLCPGTHLSDITERWTASFHCCGSSSAITKLVRSGNDTHGRIRRSEFENWMCKELLIEKIVPYTKQYSLSVSFCTVDPDPRSFVGRPEASLGPAASLSACLSGAARAFANHGHMLYHSFTPCLAL